MTIPSFLPDRVTGQHGRTNGRPPGYRTSIWRCPNVDLDECVILVGAVDTGLVAYRAT